MGFGTFNANTSIIKNMDERHLVINDKKYRLIDLYSSGQLPKFAIKLDKTLTIDDLVYFLSWEKFC